MSKLVDGKTRRIGLALSGGGFRAAAFHLGVFKKLQALRLLDKLDLISCVSGGSIAGATLMLGWRDLDATLKKLEVYLLSRSIAVSSVLAGALDPFQSRTDKLAQSYDRDLYQGATLSALRDGPRAYFNSTNLATGNMFFIVAGGGKDAEMGDHELPPARLANDFLISRAVAASSSFPPVFPPLRLDEREFPPTEAVEYVTLTDGGVYDNLGINPTLRAGRNPLDFVIVSDAGKPFAIDSTPTESGVLTVYESLSILMEQVRGLQLDRLIARHNAGSNPGPKPVWFSIDSTKGEEQAGDAADCGSIGTNLKRLSQRELDRLVRHGGALVEARLRTYAPELLA